MSFMSSFLLSTVLLVNPIISATKPSAVVIDIRGMVCAFCASSIEDKFKEIKGVREVFVDLKTRTVIVGFEGPVTMSDKEINTLILDSGYTQRQIVRSEESIDLLKKKYIEGFKTP